jgi:thiamine pyrophosphate-dependent acetolactate synthase large subunit-like protein
MTASNEAMKIPTPRGGIGRKIASPAPATRLEPALERAKAAQGPAAVCVRTDRDANLSIPSDPLLRFIEVYQGPLG